MKKIHNPFAEMEGHNCFGCSPENPYGLNLKFTLEENLVKCEWLPGKNYQGYKNVLHGGIQATIMDEIASWSVFVLLKTAGVTTKLEVNYKRPCLITDQPIRLTSVLQQMDGNVANLYVELFDSNGKLCTFGNIFYYTFDQNKAKNKLKYPGYEKFVNE